MKKLQRFTAAAALGIASLFASAGVQASTVTVDVSGAQSVNLLGESGNTVWFVNIGANALLTSLGWTLVLESFSPSSLGDMQVSFGNSSGLDALTLTPALYDPSPGVGHFTDSLDLTPYGVAVGSDGLLRIEFSESYKDLADAVVEGVWLSGSLNFGVADAADVPEPASTGLVALGLGLVGLQARRARRG